MKVMRRQSDVRWPRLESQCRWVARSYFPPPGLDEDDLLQEARIGAWKALRDYRPDAGANFHTFADICIKRQIITAIKAATRQKHEHLNRARSLDAPSRGADNDGEGEALDVLLGSPAADPERRLLDRERLQEALDVLRMDTTKLERECFLAFEVDGHPYDVVAEALGIVVKSVDNYIQRVRHKLARVSAEPQCDVCGVILEFGRRCPPCDDEIEFARRFVA